ncbi:MAG: prepilin-type N-terminal cleavage/methylation domain-containing protein [Bacilli bacterium]|nr:prepilin-type N-terminal cleavage/methylation domain-containing protein [Bacilli bacterium]
MKNQKGFTLVELIASFSLALVIMFFLFQIVITVKELYVSSGLKTEMLIRQANLERQIGLDFKEKVLTSVASCGTDCYRLVYGDNTSKELKVDRNRNIISYGAYQISIQDGSKIGNFTITKNTISGVSTGKDNTILLIDIPITNKVVAERNFGVHMVYQYDSRSINIGL